ncbi:MAG: ribosomal protein S18-alanine N-acetyltransferase [Lachnospiraceae bacterium]|nr:ribosomal protein S18-alanine N-acetyltransferase [Lachnospiraceae bacterium]
MEKSEIKIRRMNEEDLAQVLSLENACFSKPWSEKSFLDALHSEQTLYLVAEAAGAVIGYCGFFFSFESADLCNMLVEEKMRKNGIGRKLLEEAFLLLGKRQIEKVILEVRASNASAIHLYEMLGFEKIGIRKRYYSEPVEDALLMKKCIQ